MKKYNIYSKIILILSFLAAPLSLFSVLDEFKIFRLISLLILISIFILGRLSLKQIKKTGEKGRGYAITSIIISIIILIFLILMSVTPEI